MNTKYWKGWAGKAVWGVDVFDQNQRNFPNLAHHQWFREPSMIVGAIDISGMQSPGGGAVPYLEPKHQSGMKPQYHLDISHARHLKPWLGNNFQLLGVCAGILDLYGKRTKGERARLARETIGKRLLGAEPRQSLISILWNGLFWNFRWWRM